MTKTVQDLLLQFVKISKDMPIYRRNVLLARVATVFKLTDEETRVQELCKYIEDQIASAACFDDIKEYLECLDADELKYVAYDYMPQPKGSAQASATLLSLQLQYFVATCPRARKPVAGQALSTCLVCNVTFPNEHCASCLQTIESKALEAFVAQQKSGGAETLPELAMAVAFCNIQLAFRSRPGYKPFPPDSAPLVRALLILEHQYFATPKHSQIALVLVQLHLYLGSAHRCGEIWHDLAVKRTIVDSLAPIFYDRLSTISPAILDSSEEAGYELVEPLRSHYSHSLKLRMPRRLIDAFEAGNYTGVLSIPRYMDDLREGCTRAMGLVEESRADRLLGEPCGELLHDTRYSKCVRDIRDLANQQVIFPTKRSSRRPSITGHFRRGNAMPRNLFTSASNSDRRLRYVGDDVMRLLIL